MYSSRGRVASCFSTSCSPVGLFSNVLTVVELNFLDISNINSNNFDMQEHINYVC